MLEDQFSKLIKDLIEKQDYYVNAGFACVAFMMSLHLSQRESSINNLINLIGFTLGTVYCGVQTTNASSYETSSVPSPESRTKMHVPLKTNSMRLEAIGFEGKIPDEFICPISRDIMDEPVITSDGRIYDQWQINRLLEHNPDPACPLNPGLKIKDKFKSNTEPYIPNYALKSRINDYVNSLEKEYDDAMLDMESKVAAGLNL